MTARKSGRRLMSMGREKYRDEGSGARGGRAVSYDALTLPPRPNPSPQAVRGTLLPFSPVGGSGSLTKNRRTRSEGGCMTTLQEIELRCPVCDARFRSQAVVATNSFGGKRTDFHERAAGTQPLPYLVHTCARCGYSGDERDFADEAGVGPLLKAHVWNELAPAVRPASLPGSEKYEAAAKVAAWRSAGPRQVADLFLRAAWCC